MPAERKTIKKIREVERTDSFIEIRQIAAAPRSKGGQRKKKSETTICKVLASSPRAKRDRKRTWMKAGANRARTYRLELGKKQSAEVKPG